MKELLFVFVPVIVLTGCTSSYVVSPLGAADSLSYQEFNGKVSEEKIRIELTSGLERAGKNLKVSNDSAKWVDPPSDSAFVIAADEIKTVVGKNHWFGGLEGFGFGLLAGATLGYLSTSEKDISFFGHLAPLYFAGAGGVAGGVVGGIIGLIVGHKYEYQFVKGTDRTKK